ncbi:hypothetical protein CYMTET_42538 [Cymbomonas tetramitiformis]|uniref:Uncharacterized protein n=1 Tax=Cymbomonas tetramitiformis TaxID=36881 RepID=A0AAE0C502_9CHLO|nr:hypothetical protein CYMTET_42538 [Cymbomonas tetramitiformis]
MISIKIAPEGEEVQVANKTPYIPDVPKAAELESGSRDDCEVAIPPPSVIPPSTSTKLTGDVKTIRVITKSLGGSAVPVNLLRITLQRLSPKERKELRVAHRGGGKKDAIWRVLAAPMATRALEGWQGSLSKAIVAGVLCSLSAAGCDASANVAHTALHCLATLQQQHFSKSPPSPQSPTEWTHLLDTAITEGLQTLDSYDDDTYISAGKVVGKELIKALGSEAGEVLVAASAALHAWQKMGDNSALVKQARKCGQALLAASLAQHWSNNASGPTDVSFPGGARNSSDHVVKAIVYGSRAAVAAQTPLEQEAHPSAPIIASQRRAIWWCRGCMRCAGLATLLDGMISLCGDGGGTALTTLEPVLVAVVEAVLLPRLAQVLCSDEAAQALQGEVRVMLEKVIRTLDNARCAETVLDMIMVMTPDSGEAAQDIVEAAVPLLAAVIVSKLQQVCEVQEPEALKPFAEVVVKKLEEVCEVQEPEALQPFAEVVVKKLMMTPASGEAAQDIVEAAAPLLATVIVSKLQEEVCEVQDPEALRPFAEVVVKEMGIREEGCEVQDPEALRPFAEVVVKNIDVGVLHKACVGELDCEQLLESLLPEKDSTDIVKAAAPIIAAVIVSKLQQVCKVEDPEVLRPFAEVVVKEVDVEELFQICVGKLDWKQPLEKILSSEGVSHSLLGSAYHLFASKITSKLRGHDSYQVAEGAPRLFVELLAVDKDTAQAVENLLRALFLSSGAAPQGPICARQVMMVVLLASPQLCRVLVDGKAVSRLLGILICSKDVESKIKQVYSDGGSVAKVLETAAELIEDTDALKQLRDIIKGCLVARGVPKRTAAELVSEEKLPSEDLRSFVTLGIKAPIFSLTLHSLEERVADSLQDLEGTIDKLGRDVNPSALVELAKEQVQGNWGSQLLQKVYFYFMHRILPLVDLGTDALVAASLWEAGGQQRRVWFWITVTFMVLPYAVLSISVTIYWKSFWNVANPRIWRMDFERVYLEGKAPIPERLAFHLLRRPLCSLWLKEKKNLCQLGKIAYSSRPYSPFHFAVQIVFVLALAGPIIILAAPCWFFTSLFFVILIPALVILDVLLAFAVSPDRSLEGPFWASYEQLKKIVEGCLEAFPQSILQLILASTGHVPMDSTLFLSLFISIVQTFRHINYLREQAKLGRTGSIRILQQLLLLDDPDHVPYSTVLQIRPQIDYCQVRAPLKSKDLKELSQALIGNTVLHRLVFRCDQIDADGMRFLIQGLARNKMMRELEFHKVHEADTHAEFHVIIKRDSVKEKFKKAKFASVQRNMLDEASVTSDQKQLEAIKLLLEKLPSLKALHTLRLDNLQHGRLDDFLAAASSHGNLRHIFLQETSAEDSRGVQEADALELKSMQRFVQQTARIKSLELCGFNLHRRSLGHLALHKGISSLKLARCRVDFEVCHTWSYSSDHLSSVILLDVELSDPKHIQRLVERPATCDIFVVILWSAKEQLFHKWDVKLANNLGKPSKPGEDDAKQPRLVLVGHRQGVTTLVLNDNSHDDSLNTIISDVMATEGAHCIQNLYLRSNAFTATFFTQIAQRMSRWQADDTLLDLIDNDLEAAALFKLVEQQAKIKHGLTTIRLTEHCLLTVTVSARQEWSREWKAPSKWSALLEALNTKHSDSQKSKVAITVKWDDQESDFDFDTLEQADEGAVLALRAVQSPEENVTLQALVFASKWPAWFEAYVLRHLYNKRSVNGVDLKQGKFAECAKIVGARPAWLKGLLQLRDPNQKEVDLEAYGNPNKHLLLRGDHAEFLAKVLKMNDCKMTTWEACRG